MDSLPSNNTPSTPISSPFHGDGPSWKRNLLFGVLGVVLVGGSLSYFFKDQLWSRPDTLNTQDVVAVETTTDTVDLYGSSDVESTTEDAVDDFDVEVSSTEGYMTFTDHYFGFRIDYPDTWLLSPSYDYIAFSSDYESEADYLLENFNIGIEDLSVYGSMTLDEYGDAALDQLLSEPAYTFLEQTSQNVGSYEGSLFTGLYDFGGQQAGVKSFFTLQDNKAFVLTYMYELPEKDVYSTIMAHVLESFEVVGAESFSKTPNAEVDVTDLGFTSILHLGQ